MLKILSSPRKRSRVNGWGALMMVLILPAFLLACNTDKKPYETPEGVTVIPEMKLAFELPDGWWQDGPPYRIDSDGQLVETDSEEGGITKNLIQAWANGGNEDLNTVMHLYMYHNLPGGQDTVLMNMEDVVFHMLTLNVDTYYDDDQLAAWAQGRCGNKVDTYCDEGTMPANLRLIRVLEPEENPFQEGTGVLYYVPAAEIPVVVYTYYVVRDRWAYRISYEMTPNQIDGKPYPSLLDTIEFVE
ncbi:MAG: hypothetical protein KTR29_20695 [Rhodothermaceae bacterium]|nr:hypothetical protein [Rhodothermaceae bacterium]